MPVNKSQNVSQFAKTFFIRLFHFAYEWFIHIKSAKVYVKLFI